MGDLIGLVSVSWQGNQRQLRPVALLSVDVTASVFHAAAEVEVCQVYANRENHPIEAIYYFPLNPDGAVTRFEADLDGKIIKGIVKPHEIAKEEYLNAIEDKKTAFLGEETKPDIFKIRVGYLKPGKRTKVLIKYVTEVKNEPGSSAIRFYIPTTIAPRYVSKSEMASSGSGSNPGPSTSTSSSNAGPSTSSKTSTWDIQKMKFSSCSPVPLSIRVQVSLQGAIRLVESPTHFINVEKFGSIPEVPAWHMASVTLKGYTTKMDRDFVLKITPEEDEQGIRLQSERLENGSTAMMLQLMPTFQLTEQKAELIFVLDQSGSMAGLSIELAKRTLLVFLHSMPADCYFNIVGFGSTHQFLFRSSVKYNEESLRLADKHTKGIKADLSGTEILTPLKQIFDRPVIDGYLRQIFLLTDGQVSNTDEVIGIAHGNAHKARVFTLGIGDAASHYLVEGLAKAGGGTSAFVSTEEGFEGKVINQLKNALQPSLTDITVKWEGIDMPSEMGTSSSSREQVGYQQSPKRIPPVHDGSQLIIFGLFKDKVPHSATLTAKSPDGELTLRVEHKPEQDVSTTDMLHRLAAVKLVRELELEETVPSGRELRGTGKEKGRIQKEIIIIGCDNDISSKYTSFVAIDTSIDESEEEEDCWELQSRAVPIHTPRDWFDMMPVATTRTNLTAPEANRPRNRTKASDEHVVAACSLSESERRKKRCALKRKKSPVDRIPRPEFFETIGGQRSKACKGLQIRKGKSKSYHGGASDSSDANSYYPGYLRVSAGGGPGACPRKYRKERPKRKYERKPKGKSRYYQGKRKTKRKRINTSSEVVPKQHSPDACGPGPKSSNSLSLTMQEQVATKSASPTSTDSGALEDSDKIKSGMTPKPSSPCTVGLKEQEISNPTIDLTNATTSVQTDLTVTQIISLQLYNGPFKLDTNLSKILGISLQDLELAAASKNLDYSVLATALAISFLSIKSPGQRHIWELVVTKARTWLAKQCAPKQVEDVLHFAKTLILPGNSSMVPLCKLPSQPASKPIPTTTTPLPAASIPIPTPTATKPPPASKMISPPNARKYPPGSNPVPTPTARKLPSASEPIQTPSAATPPITNIVLPPGFYQVIPSATTTSSVQLVPIPSLPSTTSFILCTPQVLTPSHPIEGQPSEKNPVPKTCPSPSSSTSHP